MAEEDKGTGLTRGRWTKEEQNLFNLAYQWHGKDWKKLAEIVKSRTIIQIRSHAQKIQKKLECKDSGKAQIQKVYIIDDALGELNEYIASVSADSCKKYVEYQNELLYGQSGYGDYK